MTQQNFNFTDPGWAPAPPYVSNFSTGEEVEECYAQWVGRDEQWNLGSDLQWGECPEPFTYLKQIWTDDNYVYAATTDGLNIIDLVSEQAYAHVTYRDGFESVWADENKVYLATPASGVKYIDKTAISGSVASPYELAVSLRDLLNEPEILSDKVRYIHGNNSHMIISTASGINYRGPNLYYNKAEHHTKLARKVFITSTGRMYYLTWDGNTWKINIKYADNQNWTAADRVYETGVFPLNAGVDILDIFITEGTSDTGASNTIFVATTSGIVVIDEEIDTGDIYYTE